MKKLFDDRENVVFVSATPSAGSCPVTPGAGVVTTALNRTLQCGLNDINRGAQRTVTIRVKPTNATRSLDIDNDVSVSTTTVEPDPPGATNNDASVTVAVQDPDLDLVVNKSDDDDPLAVGDMTTYRIQVQGRLDNRWSDRLGGMDINVDARESQPPITILEGHLPDQAALAGVLNTLYELRLPLLSVEKLDEQSSKTSSDLDSERT